VLTTLAGGEGWSLGHFACRAHRHARAVEEYASAHHIGFVTRGVFVKQVHREVNAADPMQAVFFPKGESYRIHHPVEGGDDCIVLTVDDRFLAEASIDPPTTGLPSGATRLDPKGFFGLARITREARLGWDRVRVEEGVCRLFDETMSDCRGRLATRSPGAPDRVRAVQVLMSAHLDRRLTLRALGRAVGWSPFQLMRGFREQTGVPVHRYLTGLRVARAIARLADGERDLTALALGCGFVDHSHLTNVFRRHAGVTPSAARALLAISGRDREAEVGGVPRGGDLAAWRQPQETRGRGRGHRQHFIDRQPGEPDGQADRPVE
jgi:AraC family transcriptional regulator